MAQPRGRTRVLALSEWLYRILLRAYPVAFRRAYGAQMVQTFRDGYLAARREGGLGGVLRYWLACLDDLVRAALAERVQRGADMARSVIIRWCGLAGLAGGALWIVYALVAIGSVAAGRASVPVAGVGGGDLSLYQLIVVAFSTTWSLYAIGLVGLQARLANSVAPAGSGPASHASQARWLGWLTRGGIAAGGTIALIGALMLCAGSTGMIFVWAANSGTVHQLNGTDRTAEAVTYALYAIGFLGYPVLGAGMALMGALGMRARSLPRWNALPLTMGVFAAIQYFFTDMGAPSILRNTGTPGLIVMAGAYTLFVLVWSAGWIVLGRMLWSQGARPATSQPEPALG